MFRCAVTGRVAKPHTAPVICYSYAESYEHSQTVKGYDSETGRTTKIVTSGSGRQITGQMLVLPEEKALRSAEAKGFQPHGGTEHAIQSIARAIERQMMEDWGPHRGPKTAANAAKGDHPEPFFAEKAEDPEAEA